MNKATQEAINPVALPKKGGDRSVSKLQLTIFIVAPSHLPVKKGGDADKNKRVV